MDFLTFVAQYKEVVALAGVALGLVPRFIDIVAQTSAVRKERRRLELELQQLQVVKLRYEIDQLRGERGRGTGEGAAGVAAPGPMLQLPPAGAVASGAVQQKLPEWVAWVRRRAWLAAPVLGGLVVVFVFFFAFSVLMIVAFPFTVMEEGAASYGGGWNALGVEVVYVLATWGFWVLLRKSYRWWKSPVTAS